MKKVLLQIMILHCAPLFGFENKNINLFLEDQHTYIGLTALIGVISMVFAILVKVLKRNHRDHLRLVFVSLLAIFAHMILSLLYEP